MGELIDIYMYFCENVTIPLLKILWKIKAWQSNFMLMSSCPPSHLRKVWDNIGMTSNLICSVFTNGKQSSLLLPPGKFN